ncbi:hypothetical protein HC928_07165, partial [bacterium]|nr:hypothetical protein [bacterium]
MQAIPILPPLVLARITTPITRPPHPPCQAFSDSRPPRQSVDTCHAAGFRIARRWGVKCFGGWAGVRRGVGRGSDVGHTQGLCCTCTRGTIDTGG